MTATVAPPLSRRPTPAGSLSFPLFRPLAFRRPRLLADGARVLLACSSGISSIALRRGRPQHRRLAPGRPESARGSTIIHVLPQGTPQCGRHSTAAHGFRARHMHCEDAGAGYPARGPTVGPVGRRTPPADQTRDVPPLCFCCSTLAVGRKSLQLSSSHSCLPQRSAAAWS